MRLFVHAWLLANDPSALTVFGLVGLLCLDWARELTPTPFVLLLTLWTNCLMSWAGSGFSPWVRVMSYVGRKSHSGTGPQSAMR